MQKVPNVIFFKWTSLFDNANISLSLIVNRLLIIPRDRKLLLDSWAAMQASFPVGGPQPSQKITVSASQIAPYSKCSALLSPFSQFSTTLTTTLAGCWRFTLINPCPSSNIVERKSPQSFIWCTIKDALLSDTLLNQCSWRTSWGASQTASSSLYSSLYLTRAHRAGQM
jgi:hypothetical protein